MEALDLTDARSLKSSSAVGEQSGKDEFINVGVRFRPLNSRELETEQEDATNEHKSHYFDWTTTTVTPLFAVTRSERSRQIRATTNSSENSSRDAVSFNFDRVYSPHDPTHTVYDELTRDLVVSAMSGVHSAVFAFGQTSTGKTFTMQGTAESPGIIPRAVEDVFEYVYNHPDREFLLRVSYLEVYNESINDLLNPSSSNLRVFEDKVLGPYVHKLEEKVVVTPEQIFSLIASGEAQRHIGATNFNEQSSRSHTIFRLVIESKRYQVGEPGTPPKKASGKGASVQVATLNLVDLAGSESAHGTRSRQHKQEGSYINKSLLTLTHVIFKLSDLALAQRRRDAKGGGRVPSVHIPYRDSKLTRILQPALQGNSRISIICTATPWGGVKEETLNTLRFATRAKKVRRVAKVNQVVDDRALMLQYKQEIAELRRQLAEARRNSQGNVMSPTSLSQLDLDGGNLVDEMLREQIDQAIRNLNRVILNSSLTDSERKRGNSKSRRITLDSIPAHDTLPSRDESQVPFFSRSRSSGTQVSLESLSLEDHSERLAPSPPQSLNLDKSNQKMDNLPTPKPGGNQGGDSPATMQGKDFRSGKFSSAPHPATPRKLVRSLSFDGASLKLVSQTTSDHSHSTVVASELKTIRDHLEGLLHGVTAKSPRGPQSFPQFDDNVLSSISLDQAVEQTKETSPASTETHNTKEYIATLEAEVASLRKQVERSMLESNVSRADRSFLEDLLKEKDRTINEWTNVIKEIEERQSALEMENVALRERLQQEGISLS